MEDVHSAMQALLLVTLFLTILLCLSSETSLNIFFSHRTSTSSAFEVITETRYINYLLIYLPTVLPRIPSQIYGVLLLRGRGKAGNGKGERIIGEGREDEGRVK